MNFTVLYISEDNLLGSKHKIKILRFGHMFCRFLDPERQAIKKTTTFAPSIWTSAREIVNGLQSRIPTGASYTHCAKSKFLLRLWFLLTKKELFWIQNSSWGSEDGKQSTMQNGWWHQLNTANVIVSHRNGTNFLHGSWWPDLQELFDEGVPVYRFLQKPGDLVWVNSGKFALKDHFFREYPDTVDQFSII